MFEDNCEDAVPTGRRGLFADVADQSCPPSPERQAMSLTRAARPIEQSIVGVPGRSARCGTGTTRMAGML